MRGPAHGWTTRICQRDTMPRMLALHVLVTALGVALGALYPFVSVILASLGFSPGEIGLIASAGAIGFTIAVPAWGHLADVRLGRPRTLQLCAIGAGAAVAALLVPWPPLVVVLLFWLFWIFQSSWQPLADAITVNAIRGRDFARVRLFTSLGFAVAAIGSGLLYDRTGYTPAFALFAIAALVMAGAAALLPDVARADLGAHRRRLAAAAPASAAPAIDDAGRPPTRTWRFGSAGVALRVAPRMVAVLVAGALLHFGIISGFTFLALRIESLGGSPSDIALASGLSAGAEIPAMLVMGKLAPRIGLRAMFSFSAVLYAGCLLSWTVIEIPTVIVATRMLTGIAFSGVVVGVVLTIARLLPADLQATGQALFQTSAFGVAAVVANVVGGVLYEAYGHVAVFALGSLLAVVAAGIGWLAFPSRAQSSAPLRVRQSGT
jgi:PPP family 3-phenylpropionic acid transporter